MNAVVDVYAVFENIGAVPMVGRRIQRIDLFDLPTQPQSWIGELLAHR